MTGSNKRKREHKAIPNSSIEDSRLEDQKNVLILNYAGIKKQKKVTSKVDELASKILEIIRNDSELGVHSIIKKLPEQQISATCLKHWLKKYGLNTKERRSAAVEEGEIDQLLSKQIDLDTFLSKEHRFALLSKKRKYDSKKFAPLILEIINDYPEKGSTLISKDLERLGHSIPSEKIRKYLKKHNLSTKDKREKAVESGEIKKLIFQAKNDQYVDTTSSSHITYDLGSFPQKLLNYKLPANLQKEFFRYLEEKHPGEDLLKDFDLKAIEADWELDINSSYDDLDFYRFS